MSPLSVVVSVAPSPTAAPAPSGPVTPTATARPSAPTSTGPLATPAPPSPTAIPTVARTPAALPYTISGRVTSGGSPIGGVVVRLLGDRTATATTDAGGRYEIPVPDGTYGVHFDPPAPYVAEYHLDAGSTFDASPVRVTGASVTVNADLLRGAALSGTITCGSAGIPNVIVLAADAAPPYDSYRGRTGTSGEYRIGVPAGRRYLIAAEPPSSSGCALAWSGTRAYYAEAAEAVAVGGDTTKDVVLPPARRLTGTVTKVDGTPAAGATVEAHGADADRVRFRTLVSNTRTDAAGRYEMILPPTVVRLYAHDVAGTADAWWDGKASWAAAAPVDLTAGPLTIEIRLARR